MRLASCDPSAGQGRAIGPKAAARVLLTVALCWAGEGCQKSGVQFKSAGTPRLKFEARAASTVAQAGWEVRDPPIIGGQPTETGPLYLSPQVKLTNADLSSSAVEEDPVGYWQIRLTLNSRGKSQLAQLSSELYAPLDETSDKRLAILVDGRLLTAPRVVSPLTNGQCILTGKFTREEAEHLAAGVVGPLPEQ